MEILENALKTIPGLALVFAVSALLLLDKNSELAAAIRVFIVAWVLYRIGSYVDWFFDLAYGPGPRHQDATEEKMSRGWPKVFRVLDEKWSRLRKTLLPGYKRLEERRDKAAQKLKLRGVKGVYKRAKEVLETTADWKSEVDPLTTSSKAARTFIIPLFLVSIVVSLPGQRSWILQRPSAFIAYLGNLPLLAGFETDFARAQEKLDFLRHPAIPALGCLISIGLYLSRRLRHLKRLYDLVVKKV